MAAFSAMEDDDVAFKERRGILLSLKSTVEGLLVSQSTNVWNTYGGLTRLSKVVHGILGHRLNHNQGIHDYWQFLAGLRVLVPTLSPEFERQRLSAEGHPLGRSFAWVQARLQEHSLSKYLVIILGDRDHLKLCFQESAFLRQDDCCRALLVCLKAVQNNELTILTTLDPSLFIDRRGAQVTNKRKGHIRSPSLPANMYTYTSHPVESNVQRSPAGRENNPMDCIKKNFGSHKRKFRFVQSDRMLRKKWQLRNSHSEPAIGEALIESNTRLNRSHGDMSRLGVSIGSHYRPTLDSHIKNDKASTCAATDVHLPSHNHHHVRSKSDVSVKSNDDDGTLNRGDIYMSSSLPCFLQDEQIRRSDHVDSHQERTTPIFRRPVEGQSLTSFLSSQDFRTCAELDKENAHFSISEALIAAIEQIKCNQMLRVAEEEDADSDDDEIKSLKQRIRIRRRERIQEKTLFKTPQLLSDGQTDTATTTSLSLSPRSTSSDKSDGNTSESLEPIDVSDVDEGDNTLSALQESGLSLSLASLYSEADLGRAIPVQTVQPPTNHPYDKSSAISVSAESVALSLIRKFSEKQLPKASDLEWLVSEQDAPQKLLPLPSSWPVSPDDAENVTLCQTRLRGNLEWAPPRPQIIFNVHPTPQRKVLIAKQNYRCSGCGTKIDKGFIKRLNYCEYLGKYFCQCCHNGSLAYIPAYVLRKFDFTKYPVSNFSRDLLDKIFQDPLYDISHLNASLYRRVKVLTQVLQCRLQLYYIKDFVRACRICESFNKDLNEQVPTHVMDTPHLYSMLDLLQVKSGEMLTILKSLLTRALSHIVQCELCQARGFFCEFCKNNQEVIFPFQLDKVMQCPGCRSCHHIDCYIPEKCPKCARLKLRRQRLLQDDDEDNDRDHQENVPFKFS